MTKNIHNYTYSVSWPYNRLMLALFILLSEFIILCVSTVAATYLQMNLGVPAVFAACSVALIGSFSRHERIRNLVYLGTFCSMGQSMHNSQFLLLAFFLSIVAFIVYQLFEKKFNGLGGKLGTLAFFTSFIVYIVRLNVFN